ncbi:hypothetical protein ZIOFF_024623 [Zingiber officinale]|uniref:AT-hook motif nuclear-localized protein n=1 Tax=Zingiber officinale TaxID=94328 RepID=A0A8J5LDN2_ZINOF|nr:hypothetical protein ZIOFF_024623 [Zingiber officinale]
MDGRDAMELSGAASYYIAHRGIHGSSVGSQPGLHLTAQPGARSIPNLGTRLAVPPSGVDSVAFQVESPLAASSHGGGRLGKGVSQVEPVKRKRGRPRKYGQEGSVALALSPISTSAPTSSVIGSVSASGSGVPTQKRGRGRPPGTGRKQVLASLGDWVAGSAGMGFTPHVITIAVGEGCWDVYGPTSNLEVLEEEDLVLEDIDRVTSIFKKLLNAKTVKEAWRNVVKVARFDDDLNKALFVTCDATLKIRMMSHS